MRSCLLDALLGSIGIKMRPIRVDQLAESKGLRTEGKRRQPQKMDTQQRTHAFRNPPIRRTNQRTPRPCRAPHKRDWRTGRPYFSGCWHVASYLVVFAKKKNIFARIPALHTNEQQGSCMLTAIGSIMSTFDDKPLLTKELALDAIYNARKHIRSKSDNEKEEERSSRFVDWALSESLYTLEKHIEETDQNNRIHTIRKK